MAFIKGPWEARRSWEGFFDPDPDELDHYMSEPITQIYSVPEGRNVVSCHDLFEIEPDDAKLIAAAPDLLEALEAVMGWYYNSSPCYDGYNENMPSSLLDTVDNAIAKAKGESITND